jgi:hypothetical protein
MEKKVGYEEKQIPFNVPCSTFKLNGTLVEKVIEIMKGIPHLLCLL